MNYYKRKLPHWQPEGAEYFITMRLHGSLPQTAIGKLRTLRKQLNKKSSVNVNANKTEKLERYIQRKIFKKYEDQLDNAAAGPTWLRKKEVANLIEESIHYRNGKFYDLYAYCIMPNHLHIAYKHLIQKEGKKNPVTDIMRNFKRYTARECNRLLNRTGSFWQAESYDRVIRDWEELEKTIIYILNNPVKTGLVKSWENWPYSYCKPEFLRTV